MSLTKFIKQIGGVDTNELIDRLSLYKNLQSKGVRDEVMISFLETELDKRKKCLENIFGN
jgi:hypothetical protein